MSGEFDPRTVAVRDAATVMLVRDGDDGLEVFMVRRALQAVFAGGLYVFPGGALDEADRQPAVGACSPELTDVEASRRLQLHHGGLAYWAAAIRECFEEAGVLLALHASGAAVRFDDPDLASRFAGYRRAVHAGELGLAELCGTEGLTLATGAIEYVSHWLTPVGERRRFDTRFFLARAPQAQEPLHDDHETIESLWVRPGRALEQVHGGELAMLPPTVKNLEMLVPHATADEALDAAARLGPPPRIQPKLRHDADGRVVGVALPDDPDFDELD